MSGMRNAKQKSPNTEVPPLGNPDRKRALNVLAQRRYRQRRQNKIAELEAKVTRTPPASPRPPPSTETSVETLLPTPNPSPPTDWQLNVENDFDELVSTNQCSGSSEQESDIFIPGNEMNVDVNNVTLSSIDLDIGITPEMIARANEDHGPCFLSNNIGDGAASETNLSLQTSSDHLPPFHLYSSAFADDGILEVPSLKVVKAANSVMNKLGIGDELWDPTTTQIFDAAKFPFDLLPTHYRPTDVQLSIPHHPFIDALPWPSVRNKLICTFAQPPQLRPPSARDPMAIMYLALDVDDDAEGVRIKGPDELDENSWEIGQTIFRNWWWAFSRSIIENSNRLRKDRGAGQLRLQTA